MDAKQFLAEFGHFVDAPGGIRKLRELVLQLAISGRLTERVTGDIPAAELIQANRELQKSLVAQRVLKRQPEPSPVITSDQPWVLPEGWSWTRLGSVTNYGNAPKVEFDDVDEETWVLELEDIEKGTSRLLSKVLAHERRFKSTKNCFPAGSVLYGKLRPYLDKVLIAESSGVCTTEIIPISFFENIDAGYLRWYLKSPYFISYANDSTYGMNLPRLGMLSAREALFAFPPQNEQSRIVAKVDELMALCDVLETQQNTRRKLQNSFRQPVLEAVFNAASPHELQSNWARFAENITRLFDTPEDVVTLKGLVLDLAVSGKLQSIEDCDATTGLELLEAIAEKRIEWSRIAVGQEKREAQAMLRKLRTQQIDAPELTLPENWAWASVLQVSQAIVDCHNKTAPYVSEGIHLIRTSDIRNGRMSLANTRKISEETYAYWSRRMPPESGDIFFTREAPMGEAAIVPDEEKVCLGQRVMLIRLFPELFNNRFLLYVIQSPSFQLRMADAAIGMGVKHLRVGDVESLAVPVPPKIEQDRIVAIVDDIFRRCDHYATQLSRKQLIASNLAASAVSSLSGIAIEKIEDKPVKAPETELLAPLRLGTAPGPKVHAPLATILARYNGEMTAKDLWQRFGGEIDGFYAQLKTEVAHGWISEPAPGEMREKQKDTVSA